MGTLHVGEIASVRCTSETTVELESSGNNMKQAGRSWRLLNVSTSPDALAELLGTLVLVQTSLGGGGQQPQLNVEAIPAVAKAVKTNWKRPKPPPDGGFAHKFTSCNAARGRT